MRQIRFLRIKSLCAALAVAAIAAAMPASATRQPYDGVVALVDDQIILLSELEEMRMVTAAQTPGLQKAPADLLRKELLEKLIDDKVVLVKAKQDTTIKVSERDISPRVEEAISRYVDQQGGEKKFETLLKQTNGMSLAQFRARLTQQYLDQSFRQKLQYKYVGEHDPSNQQVKEFYDRYKDSLPLQQNGLRLSHIQVKINPSPVLEKAAYLKADSLIKRLDKGEAFADLAKAKSDDASGKDGGDLGYTKRGTLDPDFERAAFGLDAGDYTKVPVRTRFGYHIIKVTGKKDDQIRCSHILVRLVPESGDSARALKYMDSLRTVALQKNSFAELASKISEDKKTKDHGGSLGWFTRDRLDPRYLQAVDSLKVGGISAPVAIGDSYHLFRLDGVAPERKMTLDEDWADISQYARNWYMGQKLSGFVKKWRETVHIENRLAQFKNLPDAAEGMEDAGSGSSQD
ncbi:MAG: peptidylprolyl isomerase [Fibrobacteres bacterium]|nr:peptidylprolyl isomerase [Fibrobacterota bacterium]